MSATAAYSPASEAYLAWLRQKARPQARAAVIDPHLHDADVVDAAARVVPDRAQRVTCGRAQLGYKHQRTPSGQSFEAKRLLEIQRIIQVRHGGPVDTHDGPVYLPLAVQLLVKVGLERAIHRREPLAVVRAYVAGWTRQWLPLVDAAEVDEAIDYAVANPRRWRADTAAAMLRLTMAERTAANVVTIGATDLSKEERARLAKERHAERQRKARAEARRAGVTLPREKYETGSIAAECRRLNISRSTFYRRQRAETASEDGPRHRCRAPHKKSSIIAHGTCVTPALSNAPNLGERQEARPARAATDSPTPQRIRMTGIGALRRIDSADIIRTFVKAIQAASAPAAGPPGWSRWRQ